MKKDSKRKKRFKKASKKQRILSLIFGALLGLFLAISFGGDFPEEIEKITYNEFLEKVKKDEVESISFKYGEDPMKVIMKDGTVLNSDNPRTETFKEEMLKEGLKVNTGGGSSANTSAAATTAALNMVLIVAIISMLVWAIRKGKNSKGAGIAKTADESLPTIKFKDIAGNEEAKKEMMVLVDYLKDNSKYKKMEIKAPSGVIMFGPPGTGKTLMAKAIAGEANVPFFYTSGSSFVEMFAGLGAQRVRKLFEQAREQAPCIIFVDEVDAIGGARGTQGRISENDQTLNAFLEQMDGFSSNDQVLVIAATNRIDSLDPAFIRPGRFDKHIHIGLPDVKARKKILDLYVKSKPLAEDVDVESLARITVGMAGADLESLVNEAALIAVTENSSVITRSHVDTALYKITTKGSPKEINRKNEVELKLIAYHEAGHAIAAKLLTERKIHKVTIVPSTSGAGGATFSAPPDTTLMSKQELINTIKMLYAGRAAEEILMKSSDKITSGASSDIQQSTQLLKAYFAQYGMSEKFGMVFIEDDKFYMNEVFELSKKLYEETLSFLNNNKESLIAIAEALIENETLSADEVDNLMK